MKNWIKSNSGLLLLLLVSLIAKVISYQNKPLYWDESTYITIGKYLYSGGAVGFKEAFRPIIWPLILGLIWKLHLDIFFVGKIIQLGFGLGTITMVYLLGKKVFNPSVALLAAVLFSLSSSYHYWNNTLLTDIPSTFIGLCAVYLVLNQRYFLGGLIGMLAFLFRFTQSLTVELIFLYLIVDAVRTKRIKPLLCFGTGLASLIIPYFIYNHFMYGNFLAAFIESKIGYTQYMAPWHMGILPVLSTLFFEESWVFVFIVPAVLFILFKNFTWEALLLFLLGLAQIAWVTKLPLEIVRYLIACLPFLYILTALGMYVVYMSLVNRDKFLSYIFLVLVLLLLAQLVLRFNRVQFSDKSIDVIQQYTLDHFEELKGKRIWMGNPDFFTYVDLKIDHINYYPRFDLKKIEYMKSHLDEADYIFLDTENMKCIFDKPVCEEEKKKLITLIDAAFKVEVQMKSRDPQYLQTVYKNNRL